MVGKWCCNFWTKYFIPNHTLKWRGCALHILSCRAWKWRLRLAWSHTQNNYKWPLASYTCQGLKEWLPNKLPSNLTFFLVKTCDPPEEYSTTEKYLSPSREQERINLCTEPSSLKSKNAYPTSKIREQNERVNSTSHHNTHTRAHTTWQTFGWNIGFAMHFVWPVNCEGTKSLEAEANLLCKNKQLITQSLQICASVIWIYI